MVAINITNVWQEIFTPMTLAFSHEVVHEKLWKSVNICKSYSKKISGTFFSGHDVHSKKSQKKSLKKSKNYQYTLFI